MSRHTFKRSLVFAGAAFFLAAANFSAAQDDVIEEIIVTATKRASTIQDVPFSINAQTQSDIQRSGATNLEELSRNVAGLTIQNLGPGQSQVAIRGVSAVRSTCQARVAINLPIERRIDRARRDSARHWRSRARPMPSCIQPS